MLRPEEIPRSISTDNAVESIDDCQELNWNHEKDLRRADPKHIGLQSELCDEVWSAGKLAG